MPNTVRVSLAAALAAIGVACSGAASKDPQPGVAQTTGTPQTSGGETSASTGSTAQVTAFADGGADIDAAADTAANRCFVACIAPDPKAVALDNEDMTCSAKCDAIADETTAKNCYSACDATQEAECKKADNQTACALADSCLTKCFSN